MSPILVPTVSELGIELQKAIGIYNAAVTAYEADPVNTKVEAITFAAGATNDLVGEIIALPVYSLPDLRVKATAFAWLHVVPEGVMKGQKTRLVHQVMDALLDERVA